MTATVTAAAPAAAAATPAPVASISIWTRIKNWAEAELTKAENFFSGVVWPFLQNLLSSTVEQEVEALMPIVAGAAANVVADVGDLFSPSGWLSAIEKVGAAVLPQLESTGVSVASESLHTAIGAALSNLKASVPAPAPAATPVATVSGTPASPGAVAPSAS